MSNFSGEHGSKLTEQQIREQEIIGSYRLSDAIHAFAKSHPDSQLVTAQDVSLLEPIMFPYRRYEHLAIPSVIDKPLEPLEVVNGFAGLDHEFTSLQRRAEGPSKSTEWADAQVIISQQNIAFGNVRGFFTTLIDGALNHGYVAETARKEQVDLFSTVVSQRVGDNVRIGKQLRLTSISSHRNEVAQNGEVSIVQSTLLTHVAPQFEQTVEEDELSYRRTKYYSDYHSRDIEGDIVQNAMRHMVGAALAASEMTLRFLQSGGIVIGVKSKKGYFQPICIPLTSEQMAQVSHMQLYPYRSATKITQQDERHDALLSLVSDALSQNIEEQVTVGELFSHLPDPAISEISVQVVPQNAQQWLVAHPFGFITQTNGASLQVADLSDILSSAEHYLQAFHPNREEVKRRFGNEYNFSVSPVREFPIMLDTDGTPLFSGYAVAPFSLEFREYVRQLLLESAIMYGVAPSPQGEGENYYQQWARRIDSQRQEFMDLETQ